MRIISEPRRQTNNVSKVHEMMEYNEMRTAIETRGYDNGGVVEMQDNGDGRQGRMWRRAAENHSGGDAGK